MALIHWVRREEAPSELGISLRTLDRWIKADRFKVRRYGRRVYVRLDGPRPQTDEEFLEKAREDLAESELAVSELRSENEQLKGQLLSKTTQVSSAESRVSRVEARASRAEYHASRARSRADDLEGELRKVRKDSSYLEWVLLTVSVVAALLAVLHLL